MKRVFRYWVHWEFVQEVSLDSGSHNGGCIVTTPVTTGRQSAGDCLCFSETYTSNRTHSNLWYHGTTTCVRCYKHGFQGALPQTRTGCSACIHIGTEWFFCEPRVLDQTLKESCLRNWNSQSHASEINVTIMTAIVWTG